MKEQHARKHRSLATIHWKHGFKIFGLFRANAVLERHLRFTTKMAFNSFFASMWSRWRKAAAAWKQLRAGSKRMLGVHDAIVLRAAFRDWTGTSGTVRRLRDAYKAARGGWEVCLVRLEGRRMFRLLRLMVAEGDDFGLAAVVLLGVQLRSWRRHHASLCCLDALLFRHGKHRGVKRWRLYRRWHRTETDSVLRGEAGWWRWRMKCYFVAWQMECEEVRGRKVKSSHAVVRLRVLRKLLHWKAWRDQWEQRSTFLWMIAQGQGRTSRRRAREWIRNWLAWSKHKSQKEGELWQAVRIRAKKLKSGAWEEWLRRIQHRKAVLEERRLGRVREARLERKKKKK